MMKGLLRKSVGFLIVGTLGFILFFPCKFRGGQTCIVDRWLNSHAHKEEMISSDTRLHRYVWPYGFLWWGSMGVAVVLFYRLNNLRKRPESNLKMDKLKGE